jgi:DNA ligase-1
MKLSTLYGKSKNGKIKQWTISVLKMGDGTCYLETEHGYEDGKKQLDQRYISAGKNIGRANETSCYEQACSEAKSAHSRKKDSGYVEDKAKIPSASDGLFLPMLAHRYDKHSSKIKFPCYTQLKYDGIRCISRKKDGKVTVWSRKGKVLDILEKIRGQLELVLEEGQCTDGEIYVHGWTFQRIISAAKKQRPDTDLLEYHIYDLPHKTLPFEDRMVIQDGEGAAFYSDYNQNFKDISEKAPNIVIAQTLTANTEDELNIHEAMAVSASYEGLMARNAGSPYVYKNRSYSLQKVKRFTSEEYEVVGFSDGEGRESGLVVWRCVTEGGTEFGVRPKGTHEERAKLFENGEKYIGEKLTVEFFELSEDGVPRFPVGVGLRPEWDMS